MHDGPGIRYITRKPVSDLTTRRLAQRQLPCNHREGAAHDKGAPPVRSRSGRRAGGVNETLPSSINPDLIGRLREVTEAGSTSSLEESRGHVYAEEHMVPGPAGDPDLAVLITRPKGSDPTIPLPGMYFIHGGGMIAGNNRTGIDWALEWMVETPMVVVSVDYRLRSIRTRRPSRMATPGLNGSATTSASLGSTPTAW